MFFFMPITLMPILLASFSNSATLPKTRTELMEISNGDYVNVYIRENQCKLRITTLTDLVENQAPVITILNDGRRSQIEAIFSFEGNLENCQIVTNRASQEDFLTSFDSSVEKLLENHGGEGLEISTYLPENQQYLVDSDLESAREQLEFDCQVFIKKMKKQYEIAVREIKNSRNASHHRHHHHNQQQQNTMNSEALHRSKRSVIADNYRKYMFWPNTKWCGHGTLAKHPHDYGKNRGLDLCCKEHDHCPLHINGLSSVYNYDNWSPFTINDCKCDIKFRDCLQVQIDSNDGFTGAYNMGRFFFNLANPRCFDMKMQNVCVKRSWWGSCIREECQLSAVTRSIEHRFGDSVE